MQLIKITEKNGQKVVSARELHAFLESKKQFADWIKHRIKKYGLVKDSDYQAVSLIGESGGKSIEYALTMDAAKELAMVEGNAKGKQARQYFIECERALKTVKLPTTKELAQMLIASEEEKERLMLINELQEKELKTSAPKIEYVDKVLLSESTYNTNLIAKELGMTAVALNKILLDKGVQYKQAGTWLLTWKFQNEGYTKTKTHIYTGTAGETKTAMQTVWTEKGRMWIHSLIKKETSRFENQTYLNGLPESFKKPI